MLSFNIDKVQVYFKQCQKLRSKANNSHDDEERYKCLLKENAVFRKGLRELNDFLSQFIDFIKESKLKRMYGMSYKYGKNGKYKKNEEEKAHIRQAEVKNYEHMLGNLNEEFVKYSNRLAQVTDPKYVLELRQEVATSKDQITQLQK